QLALLELVHGLLDLFLGYWAVFAGHCSSSSGSVLNHCLGTEFTEVANRVPQWGPWQGIASWTAEVSFLLKLDAESVLLRGPLLRLDPMGQSLGPNDAQAVEPPGHDLGLVPGLESERDPAPLDVNDLRQTGHDLADGCGREVMDVDVNADRTFALVQE